VRRVSESKFFSASEVHVGQDVGGRELTLDREAVERYRAGTASDVAYVDWAPALTLHSECYRDLSWYLPNLIGNLHARQEWELFYPLRVGATVRSRITVVERYRKRNRDYVVAEVLLTDADGRWLQRSRTHQSFLADDPGDELVVDRGREKQAERRFVAPAGDGEAIALPPRTITHAMCEAFSGPHRNYHTDVEMARALGFPDIVVQGMMTLCFLSGLLTREYGRGWLRGGKMAVSLVNVVWCEDVVTARAKVRDETEEGPQRRAHLDVWCEKADGTKVVVGTASALF
jgi:acyl dehydratase